MAPVNRICLFFYSQMGTHLNSDTKCDIDNLGYTLTESPILGTVYLISFHCPITKWQSYIYNNKGNLSWTTNRSYI